MKTRNQCIFSVKNRSAILPGSCISPIHVLPSRSFFIYMPSICCGTALLNTVFAQTGLTCRVLNLHLICWGCPWEKTGTSSFQCHPEITGIHDTKVDQPSSKILTMWTAVNIRNFIMISFLCLSMISSAKNNYRWHNWMIFYLYLN